MLKNTALSHTPILNIKNWKMWRKKGKVYFYSCYQNTHSTRTSPQLLLIVDSFFNTIYCFFISSNTTGLTLILTKKNKQSHKCWLFIWSLMQVFYVYNFTLLIKEQNLSLENSELGT